MSFRSDRSGMSQSSIGSAYSRASGIKALDDMRAAKAETIDKRQLVYQHKTHHEKQYKQ